MSEQLQTIEWIAGAEEPVIELFWLDYRRRQIDLSEVDWWQLVVGVPGASAAVLTKTTGIAGNAGGGMGTNGVANCSIAFATDEMDVPVGTYRAELTARWPGTRDRKMRFMIRVV